MLSLQSEPQVFCSRDDFFVNPLCINGCICFRQSELMRHEMTKHLRFEDRIRKNLLFVCEKGVIECEIPMVFVENAQRKSESKN